MDPNTTKLLRVLLNAYYGSNFATACRFLPEEDAERVKSLNVQSTDFSFALKNPEEWLDKIHYSWLAPILAKYSPVIRSLAVASLPDYQSSCIRHYMSLDKEPPPSKIAKSYFLNEICSQMGVKDVIPEQQLPESTFRFLAEWDKESLCKLIDLLSMYDLAEKLKHIVDRRRLRDIYACLNKEHLDYLRICMHKKEKVASPSINLDQWKGDPKELEHLLHRRGLVRFGKALSTEPPEVLWHILHRLDTGRSAIIKICLQGNEPPAVVHALKQQVQSVIEYLDTKKKP
ncbi:MAG: hypothetical protein WC222_03675 [Parachlamydiales bacterium]